jgi:hypothetical protein
MKQKKQEHDTCELRIQQNFIAKKKTKTEQNYDKKGTQN